MKVRTRPIEGIHGYVFGVRFEGQWCVRIGDGVGMGATVGDAMRAALCDAVRAAA